MSRAGVRVSDPGSRQVSAGDCLTKRRGETVVNGSAGHITWEQAERAMKQGFLPHTISTDWTPQGRAGGVIDLPNVISKFLLLGRSLGL